jgi:hypothetical protein
LKDEEKRYENGVHAMEVLQIVQIFPEHAQVRDLKDHVSRLEKELKEKDALDKANDEKVHGTWVALSSHFQ